MPQIKINQYSASSLDATKLSGALPAISGASLTGISSGKVLNIHKKKITSNGIYSTGGSWFSFGSDYGFDLTYTAGSAIFITCSGMMQSNNYGHSATHAGHSAFKWYSTTGSIPAEGSAVGGSDTMVHYSEWGLENMFDLDDKNFGIYGTCDFYLWDTPSGTAVKYYMAGSFALKILKIISFFSRLVLFKSLYISSH